MVSVEGNKVLFRIFPRDILEECHRYETHRQFVRAKLFEKGIEIVDWKKCTFMAGDSVIDNSIEFTGIIGEGLRWNSNLPTR